MLITKKCQNQENLYCDVECAPKDSTYRCACDYLKDKFNLVQSCNLAWSTVGKLHIAQIPLSSLKLDEQGKNRQYYP